VLDEYRVVGDSGQTYYASATLRAYNAVLDQWELVSAEQGTGLQNVGTGHEVGAEMHIEQQFGVMSPTPSLWRIRYYDIRPYRYAALALLVLALLTTGLQMIEPLFMRFIIDRVLLNVGLDTASRLARLQLAGAAFVAVVVLSNVIDAVRDYRQRLLNVRVMMSLRRSLFERLLHLPLSRLWDMKTGGILSRLTGDVETATGLLQMAL